MSTRRPVGGKKIGFVGYLQFNALGFKFNPFVFLEPRTTNTSGGAVYAIRGVLEVETHAVETRGKDFEAIRRSSSLFHSCMVMVA